MTSGQLRGTFLSFFERHGHRVVASSPLVPGDDPTLLFTNAGMNQFKDVFLGTDRRDYRRAATSQKCMRVSGKHNDLENVGPSLRHHTFFEMLGNFSFGDYFKEDAIAFAWSLLTDEWRLPPERLYATVFAGDQGIPRDDDAYRHWLRYLPADRVAELGAADNFWSMGETGPCGRCSEIHYYRGRELPCPEPVCRGVECSCDRFVEIWNNVFMEFDRQPDGSLRPLPAPSIDTGMGLERISAIMQGTLSNYDTDLFVPLLDEIGRMSGRRYGRGMSPADVSSRVIADHARAMTFLIADGVVPSNEWRGYVLRKIMRRAMRHGNRLGLTEPFLAPLVDVIVAQMGGAYPELRSGHAYVSKVVASEEGRFEAVLAAGLPRLEALLDECAPSGTLGGEAVFRLYDSYGLPVEFIEDTAAQRGLTLDRAGFERALEGQRERARAKSAFGAQRAGQFSAGDATRAALERTPDAFEGYDTTRIDGVPIVALFDQAGQEVPVLAAGSAGYAALARTPFYVESGGQVSDTGRLVTPRGDVAAAVTGVLKVPGWPRLHEVRVESGALEKAGAVTAEVEDTLRDATRRNHTATHLLHAALRRVLGTHVKQAGSLVAPDRFRFDFVHFEALTREQIDEIERIVTEEICRNTPVSTEDRATQEAVADGATALFGEKYGERVRVVSVPGFSMELCGGTHCRATGDIGPFVIVQESGIAAGVRRIEGATGLGALRHVQSQRAALSGVAARLNVPPSQAGDAVDRLQADLKRAARETAQLKMKAATGAGAAPGEISEFGDIRLLTRKVTDLDGAALRELADSLKASLGKGVVILGAASGEKAQFVVSVTSNVTDRLHAGNLVKQLAPIVGGGGGGRPDFAQAGGKRPDRLDDLLAASRDAVGRMLGT
ncbi:MAG TPA: alanine--tRNA ligase [Vicinamibacterales bacterium]|nr:alanine--tRNA ligase [Vicinamibacterales bacterium]HPW21094.1 alanine--tRNA ligase [Vicinamibacterales bacterium]